MKVPLHVVKARQARLAELLQQNQYLPVQTLCAELKVSEATIRRDLTVLARDNFIIRTRGGALTDFNQRFPSFSERQNRARAAKQQMALRAIEQIKSGMTCFFDAGSTVYAIARALSVNPPSHLVAVTNNLPIAEILARVAGLEINLVGGQYLPRQSVLYGNAARRNLRIWKFGLALMSAEGMNAAGLWNSQKDIVRFQRAVVERTMRCIFCLDATKLGQEAPQFLLPWEKVDTLLTDATPDQLKTTGIKLKRTRLLTAS